MYEHGKSLTIRNVVLKISPEIDLKKCCFYTILSDILGSSNHQMKPIFLFYDSKVSYKMSFLFFEGKGYLNLKKSKKNCITDFDKNHFIE